MEEESDPELRGRLRAAMAPVSEGSDSEPSERSLRLRAAMAASCCERLGATSLMFLVDETHNKEVEPAFGLLELFFGDDVVQYPLRTLACYYDGRSVHTYNKCERI